MLKETLANKLKMLRSEAGRTQAEMAETVGISLRYYQSLEDNKSEPGFAVLYKMVHTLGLNPNYVFDLPDNDPTADKLIVSMVRLLRTLHEEIETLNGMIRESRSSKAKAFGSPRVPRGDHPKK